MKIKTMMIFIVLGMSIFLSFGCNSDEVSSETIDYSQVPKPEEKKQMIQYADLNGDGVEEIIILTLEDDEHFFYTLQVNDVKIAWFGNYIEENFNIVDIEGTDGYKEIAISEYGPSNDERTSFFKYVYNRVIIPMGSIPGFYTPDGIGEIKINGTGTIETMNRGKLLHTWFYKDEYRMEIEQHSLLQMPKDLYAMNTEVTLLVDLPLKASKESDTQGITIKKGEQATILATDNQEWCLIENTQGKQGWFAVDNFNLIRELGKYASDVFEGLNYAD